jgi:hypothetical protein
MIRRVWQAAMIWYWAREKRSHINAARQHTLSAGVHLGAAHTRETDAMRAGARLAQWRNARDRG